MLPVYLSSLAIEELEIATIQNEVIERHETINDALAISVFVDNIQTVISDIETTDPNVTSVTMQSINLAIESICQNLGANHKRYFSFSSTLSIEKYRTVSLEDMKLFVNDLWKKIKDSVNELWKKIGEFWSDNFASLNKIKASLESVLDQVNNKYNRNEQILSEKVDDHILVNFNNGEDITDRTLISFVSAHYHNFNTIDELVKHTKYFNKHVRCISQSELDTDLTDVLEHICKEFTTHTFKLGTERTPMVTGEYITVDYIIVEGETDIELDSSTNKIDQDENRKIYLVNKSNLKTVILKTLDIIKETMRYKEIHKQLQDEFNQVTKTYDEHINKNGLIIDYDDISQKKTKLMTNCKKTIRLIYRINSSIPKLMGTMIMSNVKLARSVGTYAHFCLSH